MQAFDLESLLKLLFLDLIKNRLLAKLALVRKIGYF
jgi:hypothetical protein